VEVYAKGTYIDNNGTRYVKYRRATLNEFNLALAMNERGLEDNYWFQYVLDPTGGQDATVRGALKIDYVIFGTQHCPWHTPLEVDVEYWHEGPKASSGEDELKRALVTLIFPNAELISVNDDETKTMEAARRTVAKRIV